MALRVLKGKVPIIRNVTNIRAVGSDRLEKVVYDAGGKTHEINASTLLRHEGIIPRTHILNSLNAKHAWDGVQRYWHPVVDENGRTSVDGISIAGDGTYVHGGDASMLKGAIAGVEIARRLGVISDAEAAYRSGPAAGSSVPCASRAGSCAMCSRPIRPSSMSRTKRWSAVANASPPGISARPWPKASATSTKSSASPAAAWASARGRMGAARTRGNHRRRPVQGARRRGLPPSPPALPAGQPRKLLQPQPARLNGPAPFPPSGEGAHGKHLCGAPFPSSADRASASCLQPATSSACARPRSMPPPR